VNLKLVIFLAFLCFKLPSYGQITPCVRDLQTNFFTYEAVAQAFSMSNVPQSQWDTLFRSLQDRQGMIPALMKQKGRERYPGVPESSWPAAVVVDLLFRAAFDVFAQVMFEFGINRIYNIQSMFKYIRSQQAGRINGCFGMSIIPSQAVTE
jgi:hypothetical protein